MQIPLKITFRHMDPSEAMENRIREKARKLERFHERITGCQVTIETQTNRHQKGTIWRCLIDLTMPGREIVASRSPDGDHSHEDPYVAVRDAFDAVYRQLEDHARRQRGEVKSHEAPPIARVVRLFPNDGYGFFETADGLQVYFHENSLVNGSLQALQVGSQVRFTLADNESEKGPQATTVHPL